MKVGYPRVGLEMFAVSIIVDGSNQFQVERMIKEVENVFPENVPDGKG